jgi:NAD(P)-dependent dehydrogenase (short-subunit alcohol dehydrogenase family)
VTGGARGIGRGSALALARAGFAVALVDVLVPEMARTAAEIARDGVAPRRLGTPEDVAQLVVCLASSEPCYITGQDFKVDGFQYDM